MLAEFTFTDLQSWLDGLPDQRRIPVPIEGASSVLGPICETGDKYVEFHASALARPDDVSTIERVVATNMYYELAKYFTDRHGRIYWRIPFETDISDAEVVIRYDENGPDREFTTDRKCFMDRSWRRVACYCRLFRAEKNDEIIRRDIHTPTNWQRGYA